MHHAPVRLAQQSDHVNSVPFAHASTSCDLDKTWTSFSDYCNSVCQYCYRTARVQQQKVVFVQGPVISFAVHCKRNENIHVFFAKRGAELFWFKICTSTLRNLNTSGVGVLGAEKEQVAGE
jgi:hypothetical protein